MGIGWRKVLDYEGFNLGFKGIVMDNRIIIWINESVFKRETM